MAVRIRVSMWLKAAAVGVLAAGLMWLLAFQPAIGILEAATIVGVTFGAAGAYAALQTLRDGHEWNRRHFTNEILSQWDPRTRAALDALAAEFPAFFHPPEARRDWHIDINIAIKLARGADANDASDPTSVTRLEATRRHLVCMFNYFEDIATAYESHVVVRQRITESAAPTMIDASDYFRPFIDEMARVLQREPWPPFMRVVSDWRALRYREDTTRTYKERVARGRTLEPPTGV